MSTAVGSVTKLVFEHTPEAHKLHIEFAVATGQAVKKGDLVIMNTDGTIQPAGSVAKAYTILGVAIKDAAADEFVTVAVRAYCVVWGEGAAATCNCGPVETRAWNATTLRREYMVVSGADDAAKADNTIGFNLTPGAGDGTAIKVALLS